MGLLLLLLYPKLKCDWLNDYASCVRVVCIASSFLNLHKCLFAWPSIPIFAFRASLSSSSIDESVVHLFLSVFMLYVLTSFRADFPTFVQEGLFIHLVIAQQRSYLSQWHYD